MRATFFACVMAIFALPADADTEADRLVDAMGIPALIAAFSEDGLETVRDINDGFLNGQGGDVFAETTRRLYDPARLEPKLRADMIAALDPRDARQALAFFESAQGQRIIALEVQARQAMVDDAVEETAKAAASRADDATVALLSVRNLVDRNTDVALAAQRAFFDGLAATSDRTDMAPDIEGQRDTIAESTRAWLTGYYMLVASALEPDDMDVYIAFWETDVGQSVDAALYSAFEGTYVDLSFGLGQLVGRLLPQNEL